MSFSIQLVKATTRNFNIVLILAAPVDKSGSVCADQGPFRKPLILLQQRSDSVLRALLVLVLPCLHSLRRSQQYGLGPHILSLKNTIPCKD